MSGHTQPLRHLGEMPVEEFLTDYWQKKPLLIRKAFADFRPPFTAEELAGFALEEGVESRLLIETPDPANALLSGWHLEHGPLDEDRFAQLPPSHWTLLVQAVDQWVPEVHELLNRFRFIPNWRLDDVMVSYAADKGSVGPHFDYYDVFLLQAWGKRRWQVGPLCDHQTDLREDVAMKLLTDFAAEDEWVLEPGDMLYLPPQVAHWGIADGACMTFSIGFRAPSHSELLLGLSHHLAEQLTPDQRYADVHLAPQHPGEITSAAIDSIRRTLQTLLDDETALAEGFGRLMTEPKRQAPEVDTPTRGEGLRLAPTSRAAFLRHQDNATVFIDGDSWPSSSDLAEALCHYETIRPSAYSSEDQRLITQWLEAGYLV